MITTRKALRLPMTATFVSYARAKDGKVVAHSLDFDLVSVAENEQKALDKLRLSVKTYVEYGLSNCWGEDILFPAPQEYWERFDKATKIQQMDPIGIVDDRMRVVRATIVEHANSSATCEA
jgi:hypothetical protein